MKSQLYLKFKMLLLVLPLLGACSPYVYEKEITTFGEGVDKTSQAMIELTKQQISYLEEKRDEELLKSKTTIDINTNGCDTLRTKYTTLIAKGEPIDKKAFKECFVTPTGPSIDPGISNILALTEALNRYSASLISITKAEDENDLKNAFSEFNASTKKMLEALNEKLDENNEKKYNAISGLVWTTGSIILNQRRFNTLKEGVNQADPIVSKISKLLQEAAFYLYEKNIKSEYRAMLDYANSVDTTGDYLANWKQVDQKVAAYVNTIKNSPVNAFDSLSKAHSSLKDSINDPANQEQLNAVFQNAKTFKDSADSVIEALK